MDAQIVAADTVPVQRFMLRASARCEKPEPLLKVFGAHMVQSSIPRNFKEGGRPTKWPGATRWDNPTSDPLFDQGALLRSIGYRTRGEDLEIFSPLKKAALLHYGGIVKPKKRFLVRPIVGPGALTLSQARTMKPRDFHGAFVLMDGPEGPGIYIKSTTQSMGISGRRRIQHARSVVRIFAFMESAKIPARPYVVFQSEDMALFGELLTKYIFTGDPRFQAAA